MNGLAAQFSLLREMNARGPFAYLDNAATTQKPDCVVQNTTVPKQQMCSAAFIG